MLSSRSWTSQPSIRRKQKPLRYMFGHCGIGHSTCWTTHWLPPTLSGTHNICTGMMVRSTSTSTPSHRQVIIGGTSKYVVDNMLVLCCILFIVLFLHMFLNGLTSLIFLMFRMPSPLHLYSMQTRPGCHHMELSRHILSWHGVQICQ